MIFHQFLKIWLHFIHSTIIILFIFQYSVLMMKMIVVFQCEWTVATFINGLITQFWFDHHHKSPAKLLNYFRGDMWVLWITETNFVILRCADNFGATLQSITAQSISNKLLLLVSIISTMTRKKSTLYLCWTGMLLCTTLTTK